VIVIKGEAMSGMGSDIARPIRLSP
jgi:hypothetical protein